jgi:hypothetical protein
LEPCREAWAAKVDISRKAVLQTLTDWALEETASMERFQDSLAVGLVAGRALAVPTWWALGLAKLQPAVANTLTTLDFAACCLAIRPILHSGLLA